MRTHVGIVLDESTSMSGVRNETISMLNEQIAELQKSEITNRVTLAKFATTSQKPIFEDRKATKIYPFTGKEYKPDGMTALNDAIVEMVERLDTIKLKKKDAVLLIVISDGMENQSKTSNETVRKIISEKQEHKQWTIVYLGQRADARVAVDVYNFHVGNTRSFNATSKGLAAMSTSNALDLASYASARSAGETSVINFVSGQAGADGIVETGEDTDGN